MSKPKYNALLPLQDHGGGTQPKHSWHRVGTVLIALAALGLATCFFALTGAVTGWILFENNAGLPQTLEQFYFSVRTHDDLCVGGISHSGYIGLRGETEDEPRRSFFWYEYIYIMRAYLSFTLFFWLQVL